MSWSEIVPDGPTFRAPLYSVGAKSPEGWVYTAGIVAIDETGKTVGIGDVRQQARHVIGIISEIVTKAGGTLADICFVQIFIKSYSDYAVFNEVYKEFFGATGAAMPPRFCIKADLVKDEWLVEMTAVAIVG